MRKLLCLVSFATAALELGCVTVPNARGCSAGGSLARGAICGENLTDKKWDLTFAEYLDMLEPQEERDCVQVQGMTVCAEHPAADATPAHLPKRAGAVCRSAEDDQAIHTALEQACRELGKACSYEIKKALKVAGVPQS
jgi:hypothetical protein